MLLNFPYCLFSRDGRETYLSGSKTNQAGLNPDVYFKHLLSKDTCSEIQHKMSGTSSINHTLTPKYSQETGVICLNDVPIKRLFSKFKKCRISTMNAFSHFVKQSYPVSSSDLKCDVTPSCMATPGVEQTGFDSGVQPPDPSWGQNNSKAHNMSNRELLRNFFSLPNVLLWTMMNNQQVIQNSIDFQGKSPRSLQEILDQQLEHLSTQVLCRDCARRSTSCRTEEAKKMLQDKRFVDDIACSYRTIEEMTKAVDDAIVSSAAYGFEFKTIFSSHLSYHKAKSLLDDNGMQLMEVSILDNVTQNSFI